MPSLLLGDGVFPFHPWLMKHTPKQLSKQMKSSLITDSAELSMVIEGAFRILRDRWRVSPQNARAQLKL